MISGTQTRRIVRSIFVFGLLALVGWFIFSVYPNLPRGAEWGVFRRKVDPALKAKINSRMADANFGPIRTPISV